MWLCTLPHQNQEYIIKERREYQTCQCSALNVCGESCAWNTNYSTTISKLVCYSRQQTSIEGGVAIIGVPSTRLHSMHSIEAFDALFSLLLCTLGRMLPLYYYYYHYIAYVMSLIIRHKVNSLCLCASLYPSFVTEHCFTEEHVWR